MKGGIAIPAAIAGLPLAAGAEVAVVLLPLLVPGLEVPLPQAALPPRVVVRAKAVWSGDTTKRKNDPAGTPAAVPPANPARERRKPRFLAGNRSETP